MAGILVYSDASDYAGELLSAARRMAEKAGLEVSTLAINDDDQARELTKRCKQVYTIHDSGVKIADTAAVAGALCHAVEKLDITHILLSSNRRGKELAGRVASRLDCGCITDVTGVEIDGGTIRCERNALGGATVATQAIETERKVIAVAPKVFERAEETENGTIEELSVEIMSSGIDVIEVREKGSDAVDIEAAAVLVVVGQGLQSRENLPVVERIAKVLGGEVACTKPIATDKKWLSEERIIGLSGKKCKPDLAVLLGISGQVQFSVGIRDAKTIISVNTDENANSMLMSDYMMVADIIEVVPALAGKIA